SQTAQGSEARRAPRQQRVRQALQTVRRLSPRLAFRGQPFARLEQIPRLPAAWSLADEVAYGRRIAYAARPGAQGELHWPRSPRIEKRAIVRRAEVESAVRGLPLAGAEPAQLGSV